MLKDSSEDDEDFTPNLASNQSFIHAAFDKMFANQDGFPFIIGGSTASVTHLHPPSIHILQLWQIYIDNINPLLKMTHVPSIQSKVIEATSRLHEAPKNIEALMFAIYVICINSLEDGEVQRTFGETKQELLARFFPALQQALVNAGFMRMPDPLTLQAYLLYLVRLFAPSSNGSCLIRDSDGRSVVYRPEAGILHDGHRRSPRPADGSSPRPRRLRPVPL